MIYDLKGTFETPQYRANIHLCLYKNDIDENYPDHWHSPMEILMPVKNSYTMIVAGTEYTVNPYEILCINSGVIHSCIAPNSGERYFLQIDISRLKAITGINSILSFINQAALFSPQTSPDIHKHLVKLFEEIVDEYFRSTEFDMPASMKVKDGINISRGSLCEPIIYAKFMTMLTLIGRSHLEKVSPAIGSHLKSKEYIEKFMNICRYIDENFAEELDLETVASMAGFSKFHFSRLFKEFANVSFYTYVNQQRIQHAEELLLDPSISITQVALQSGYSSSSTFNRMFKQVKNCTPTEYRRIQETRSFTTKYDIPKSLAEEKL